MSTITATPEQLAVIAAATDTSDNIIVEARAGAAKTTTLEMIAEAVPKQTTLSLAFNASIKKEMSQRLPDHVDCKTLNGLGHQIWGQFLRVRLELNKRKSADALGKAIRSTLDPEEQEEFYEDYYSDTLDMIRTAKYSGYVPEGTRGYWKPLSTREEMIANMTEIPTDTQLELVDKVITWSLRDAQQGVIDFDDQIMLPCIAPVSFPTYKLVLVDEAQDLAPINHIMIKKLVRNNRLIAVGDPYQAIYGFRGADTKSMANMAKMFSMTPYYLTINFRSDRKIIDSVKFRVPDIQAREGADEGVVRNLLSWSEEDVTDHTAIICRNNAPLFGVAIKLIAAGAYPEIVGRDVVAGLTKIMKSLGKATLNTTQAQVELDTWLEKKLAATKRKSYFRDQHACISLFLDRHDKLGDAMLEVKNICEQAGHIKLMTGHKAKGLEFDKIFFLNRNLINREEEQDLNLMYVIQTRAKHELTFVDSKGWV